MLALVLEAHPGARPPEHLRALLLGGSAAPAGLLAQARERGWPIVITYGCTETCSQVAATPYERRFETASAGAGRALPRADLCIRDGRILVRGPMRMAGYLVSRRWPTTTGSTPATSANSMRAASCHVHGRRAD